MKCKDVQNCLLSEYIDGEIGFSKKQAIDFHLSNCRKCSLVKKEADGVTERLFKSKKIYTPSSDLWANVYSGIKKTTIKDRRNIFLNFLNFIADFLFPNPVISCVNACLCVTVFFVTMSIIDIEYANIDSLLFGDGVTSVFSSEIYRVF